MNSVERVKSICKERRIAISRLERDLGFSNGYISQLRKGEFPAERLMAISNYLGLDYEYLMTGKEQKKTANQTVDGLDETMMAYLTLTDAQKAVVAQTVQLLKGIESDS